MEELMKQRAAARGWVTRQKQELVTLCDADANPSIVELRYAVELFESKLAKLDDIQTNLEYAVPDDRLEEFQQCGFDYRKALIPTLLKAKSKLDDLELTRKLSDTLLDDTIAATTTKVNVRLQKLDLPPFFGKYTEWSSFYDQFKAHVHNRDDIHPVSKMTYLTSLLRGEAKDVIKEYELTEANYPIVIEQLEKRFGRPEKIAFAHVQALLTVKPKPISKGPNYVKQLWSLRDELVSHVRSLETLDVKGKDCGVFLTPIILSHLPEEIRFEWARVGEGKERDLPFLLEFMQKEIERIERCNTYGEMSAKETKTDKKPEVKGSTPSAAALSSPTSIPCDVCQMTNHKTEKCYKLLNLNDTEKVKMIFERMLCFNCLRKTSNFHNYRTCRITMKCINCGGKHNSVLCGVNWKPILATLCKPKQERTANPAVASVVPSATSGAAIAAVGSSKESTVLQLGTVPVHVPDKSQVLATVLFDSGADQTYVTSKIIRQSNPKWIDRRIIPYNTFGGGSSYEMRNIYAIPLVCKDGSLYDLHAAEVPTICLPMFRPKIPAHLLNYFGGVEFAYEYGEDQHVEVEIVIGQADYWKVITVADAIQRGSLVTLKSVFGYVLSGAYPTENQNPFSQLLTPVPTMQMLCPLSALGDGGEPTISKLWELEAVGVDGRQTKVTLEEEQATEQFLKTIKFDGDSGRYEVSLPWKIPHSDVKLCNNEKLVKKCQSKIN